jgi:hypothetical protein
MNPDIPDDIEIGYSSSRMLPLVASAATMMLMGASITFGWFGFGGIGRYHALVGHVGLAFFCAASLLRLLSASQGPVLPIGRFGIHDLGVVNEFILTNSMADVSVCEYRRRKFFALKITPALELQLFITRSSLATLYANRAMGVGGIAISGLTADFEALIGARTACHSAAKQAGAAREQNAARRRNGWHGAREGP